MIDQVIGQFGPGSPTDEQVQKDNPHGRGWHVIKGGTIPFSDNPESDYQLFGSRHYLNYESTSGSCGSIWADGTRFHTCFCENESNPMHLEWCMKICPHGENHKYRADYFYHTKTYVGEYSDGFTGRYEESEPHWELGAN